MARIRGGGRDRGGGRVNKMEGRQVHQNARGQKSTSSGSKGPSLMELSGYNPKRQEFHPEYDNDAEQLLTDMEFNDSDTAEEHELKLRVLGVYGRRIDERKRRKDFLLERNLLHPSPFERSLTPEERALCRRYDPFMRLHSKEEHEELLQTVVEEHRMQKRIKELKEAQAAGCRTASEADRYLEQERKKEAKENSRRPKENAQVGTINQSAPNTFMLSEFVGRHSSARPEGQSSSSNVNDLDISGFCETQLLSETEKRLCCEIHLPPPVYLRMQELMTKEIFSGNITKKSDAHSMFKIEASKVDKVYDMLVRKGIAQTSSFANDLDITGLHLSEAEEELCSKIQLLPPVCPKMQEVMTKENFSGTHEHIQIQTEMGHSRGKVYSANEDPTDQRSIQKENAASGETSESSFTDEGNSEGQWASYHCNYCDKDITGRIRIKCAVCIDFDLCVECFSVGAEVTPHKSNHSYRVMDDLSFSLFSPDWKADEEMLLLEGIEMFGFGSWEKVAEHVGTKSKETCIEHYNSVYMQSPCFPLPDMSNVVGNNGKELLADTEQNLGNHESGPENLGGNAADSNADVETLS